MKKIGLLFTLMSFAVLGFAQPKIQFDQTTHDFGNIKEEGGKVTGRFTFKNVGDSTLLLTRVKPGCGCTAANYTKTPVEPGQSGFIDATYDPYNRPGKFHKNIKITTNEPQFRNPETANTPHIIYIKGEVIKRPPTIFEQAGYTVGRGMVRVKNVSTKFSLKNTQTHLDTFQLKNFWTKDVNIEFQKLPEYITETYRSFGPQLKAGQEGIIVVKYDASKRNAFGNLRDNVSIKTTDSLDATKTLFFNVEILEDFSKLTKKQLEAAPILVIDSQNVKITDVPKNIKTRKEFNLTNNGKTTLILRQITTTNSLTYSIPKMEIEPGETVKLTATYDSRNRKGVQRALINIICNDPKNSTATIEMMLHILP